MTEQPDRYNDRDYCIALEQERDYLRDEVKSLSQQGLLTQPKHIEGWQPIETAPKDGTEIWVATTDDEFEFAGWPCDETFKHIQAIPVTWGESNVYARGSGKWNGKGNAWMMFFCDQDGEYNQYPSIENATHWMPLPTPEAYNAIMAKEAK